MPVQGVSFKRYVEVGRVALVTKGEYKNKLVTIVEIVDQNRAVVDGPSTGVPRQVMSYRDMTLTRFVIKVPRAAGTPTVKKAFDASGVAEKWAESKWAKTLAAREARKNTTDFERFTVQVLKKQRRAILGAAAKKVQA
ncbi:Ribosomal 60S subunit protein L14B [Malassezia sympodialis ATCC 42132]|uniref:Ribosomal 60S subunit protein L14B n=1 Tax=Malassezia sympodialis (strain ATCC 42132) TaxID=1230383 RepID=A0A1M8A9H3_MALS4|nr:Ribosomal 60S subunit protein L14B [Malassezia sympodialis ATCC 42132]